MQNPADPRPSAPRCFPAPREEGATFQTEGVPEERTAQLYPLGPEPAAIHWHAAANPSSRQAARDRGPERVPGLSERRGSSPEAPQHWTWRLLRVSDWLQAKGRGWKASGPEQVLQLKPDPYSSTAIQRLPCKAANPGWTPGSIPRNPMWSSGTARGDF